MATHTSILAWRISGTVEPGGLPFMGLMHVNSSLLYKIIYLGRDLSQCLDISMMKR